MAFSKTALLLFTVAIGCTHAVKPDASVIKLSPKALSGESQAFVSHPNYLQLTLPFKPYADVFAQVQKRSRAELKSRGEAHVTVLTPPEFDALKSHLEMQEIEAANPHLQAARLEPVCVGRGTARINGHEESTYFLVVNSPELLKARRAIAALLNAKGVPLPAGFDPDHFYPHVTLGFTATDLHEQQGVVKDAKSCVYPVQSTFSGVTSGENRD